MTGVDPVEFIQISQYFARSAFAREMQNISDILPCQLFHMGG